MTMDDPASEPGGEAASRARHAEAVIERFGGIRPMAAKLGVPVTTVQGWKKRGAIPASRRAEILTAAVTHGIDLTPEELDRASSPAPEEPDHGPEPAMQPAAGEEPPPVRGAYDPAPDPGPTVQPSPGLEPQRRGGAVAATALLIAVVGLGIAVFNLVQPGGLASLRGQQAQPVARPDPRLAALEAENAALKSDVAALRQQVSALAGRPQAADPGPALRDLNTRLDALAGRLDAVAVPGATGPAAAPAATVDLSPIMAELDRLRADVTALQARPGGPDPARLAALESALAALAIRVDEVAAAPAAAGPAAGPAAALAVAASQLQAALAAGTPFGRELDLVRALTREEADLAGAIDTLSGRAAAGVPTLPALRERFGDLAGRIIAADRTRPDADWVDQTLGRVSSLVTVRRATGEVAGTGIDAVVARAQGALDRGDLARAAAEIEGLTGPAAETAAGWLAEAKARLEAEAAANAIADRAVTRLTGAP